MRSLQALLTIVLASSALLFDGTLAATPVKCSASSFSSFLGSTDAIPGAEIVDVQVRELRDYESVAQNDYTRSATIKEACEVKLLYDNPATNSSRVTITTWLPMRRESWNGRLAATGGGGWMCTMGLSAMNAFVNNGFASTTTDGGLFGEPFAVDYTLLSPGNPDMYKLERLGHRAIHDMAIASKQVIAAYYGQHTSSNYYVGCSTGGRQGMMEAARYPEDFDGLLIGAPATIINRFVFRTLAEPATMYKYNYYPTACELRAIYEAAVERCDALDGRTDGIIARQDLCSFTAQSAVGRTYADVCDATGELKTVTSQAARFYQIVVDGAHTEFGRKLGSGFPWGTDLTTPLAPGFTLPDPTTGKRSPILMPFAKQYTEDYVYGGKLPSPWPEFLTYERIAEMQDYAVRQFDGLLEPINDLNAFRKRGGKIIMYHGVEDQIIPLGNSVIKLNEIIKGTFPNDIHVDGLEKLQNFLRFYMLPGVAHCRPLPEREGKVGILGGRALTQLIAWVEAGQAPEELLTDGTEEKGLEKLCRWPSLPVWKDDGKTLTCVKNSTSFFARLPKLLEWPYRYMEALPGFLFLSTGRKHLEL